MNKTLDTISINTTATLRDVLVALDKNALGVVFLVDAERVMQGIITDGDIRRALLKGAQIIDPALSHMNGQFVSGSNLRDKRENLALMNERIRNLPILDQAGRLVDVLLWSEYWRLPIMEPVLKGKEVEYVLDCLATNWISSQGKYVERFQESFQQYLPVRHALSVSNGTAALHLALAALGIGPGDEVIVPDLTFIAPASMVILCGARPVLVDVDPETWTMDPTAIESHITPRTRALLPVHLYGHPCDMDPIMEIARRHNLYVIEDCAEALGACYRGRRVGTIGDIGTFSFFANKVITTGEGGMVTTDNPELHQRMQLLRDHGMTKERRYWHQVAGFNYRLTNMQAAVGLAQMERIEEVLAYRDKIIARYDSQLGAIGGITLPPRKPWGKNICWLYSIMIDEKQTGISRDTLMSYLAGQGIDSRPFFHPLHLQPPFASQAGRHFPQADRQATHGLSLPTSNNITMEDIDKVCTAILSMTRCESLFRQYDQVVGGS